MNRRIKNKLQKRDFIKKYINWTHCKVDRMINTMRLFELLIQGTNDIIIPKWSKNKKHLLYIERFRQPMSSEMTKLRDELRWEAVAGTGIPPAMIFPDIKPQVITLPNDVNPTSMLPYKHFPYGKFLSEDPEAESERMAIITDVISP